MADQNQEKPACFGNLEIVFPKTDDGLRHSPESCMPCFYKTECLKKAIEGKDGLTIREEKTDRAYASGNMGFFERWSKKKALRKKIAEQGHKEGRKGE
jgi:hypothetical protein